MSYCRNAQPSLIDPLWDMPKYLGKLLGKSWAKDFHDLIFPYINEENFAVLYSSNPATSPNFSRQKAKDCFDQISLLLNTGIYSFLKVRYAE